MSSASGWRVEPFNNLVLLRGAQSKSKCVSLLAASLIWQNETTAEAHTRIFTLSVTHAVTF